ncbi:MAG: DUF1631 domain-containing protein [Marinicellaceae bacterium]
MTDNKEKIVSLEKTKSSKEIYDLGGLLPQIFSSFAKDLKPRLIACFESLDDTLFDLSEKAESNQNQTLYFESMRDIRKQRNKIFSRFFDSIKFSFKQFKNNKYEFFEQDVGYNPEIKSLSLTLVDEKELDETLAKTNLINKSDMAYHRHIFAFEKRFSVLASGTKLKSNQIPLCPHVIVNSFALSINKIEIDVRLKLIMYKLFERNIMGQLNSIYTEINDFLANKGIVPEITYNLGQRNTQQPVTANNQSANASDANVVHNQAPVENNPIYSDPSSKVNPSHVDPNYQVISQLFSHSRQQSSPQVNQPLNPGSENTHFESASNNSSVSNIDLGSMINALSSLQNNLFKNNEYVNKSPTEIKEQLIKQLHESDSSTIEQKVKQKDEDTIDLVGMLFQFIVDDRNLPNDIQVILAKLQIPYLKIALKNRNVFADKTHPARELLDKLSVASVGWTKETDKNNIFLSKLETIVHEILDLEEYDNDFYSTQLKNFNHFLEKLKKKSDVAQKRSQEKTLGQDKINNAKETSAQLLVRKMKNKQMPSTIRNILLGEWSNVLVLMHLRYGSKSKEFLEKIHFVDLLIKYSSPDETTKITKQIINKITEKYKTGLNVVAYNPKESIDKQHELLTCLQKLHGIDNDSNITVEIIPPEEILKLSDIRKKHEIVEFIEEIIEPKEQSENGEPEQKYMEIIDSLKIGTWLELIIEENKTIRAKLSWKSPITSKYLFVNSRGIKITDKSKKDLAHGLSINTVKILQQVALFDRALSAIADKMKKPLKPETDDKISSQKDLKPDNA